MPRPPETVETLFKKAGEIALALAPSAVSVFLQRWRTVVDQVDAGETSKAVETVRSINAKEEFSVWDDVDEAYALGRIPMWRLLHIGKAYEAMSSFRRSETFADFLRSLPFWIELSSRAERLMAEKNFDDLRRHIVARLYPDYSALPPPPRVQQGIQGGFGLQGNGEWFERWLARDFDPGLGAGEWSTSDRSPSGGWGILYLLYPLADGDRGMSLTLFKKRPGGWRPVRHEFLPDYGSFAVNNLGDILTVISDRAGCAWSLTRADWRRFGGRLCGHGHDVKPQAGGSFRVDGWTRFTAAPGQKGVRWKFVGLDRTLEFRKNTINEPYFHLPAGMDQETSRSLAKDLKIVADRARTGLEAEPQSKVLRYWRDYTREALELLADLDDTQKFEEPILLPRAYQRRDAYSSAE